MALDENHADGVFISYSHQDKEIVDKLYDAMKEQGVKVHLDRHDFTSGSLEKNITRAIHTNNQVVVVLSRDSLASDWVWDEIATTLEKEKELDKDFLFPVRVDDSCFKDVNNKRRLMRMIRERLILDFSDLSTFEENLRKLITGMVVNQ